MFHSETYNLTITIDQQGSIPSIKHVKCITTRSESNARKRLTRFIEHMCRYILKISTGSDNLQCPGQTGHIQIMKFPTKALNSCAKAGILGAI